MTSPRKKQKAAKLTKEEAIELIESRSLSYREVGMLFNASRVPAFIGDVPTWAYACREANPEFYVHALDDMASRNHSENCGEGDYWSIIPCVKRDFDDLTRDGVHIDTITRPDPIDEAFEEDIGWLYGSFSTHKLNSFKIIQCDSFH
jgi:hypothetical protein